MPLITNNDLLNTDFFTRITGDSNNSVLPLDTTSTLPSLAVPTKPQLLTGVVNQTTVTLTWSAPLITGSTPIQSYKIYQNGTLIATTNSSTLSYVVSGLNPYNSYTFSVSAVNGDNLASGYANVTLNTVCFKEGSKILYWNEELNTEEYIPIEKLRKGMKVKTALDGYIAIEVIGKSILHNSVKHKKNKDGLYKLSTISYPELFEDLYITGAHSILVDYLTEENRKDVIELLGHTFVTGNKYRLPICLDDKSEPYNEENQFIIWHLALENNDYYSNYGIYANGLLVETCSIRFLKEFFQGELIE
jgi:hypothetical protein